MVNYAGAVGTGAIYHMDDSWNDSGPNAKHMSAVNTPTFVKPGFSGASHGHFTRASSQYLTISDALGIDINACTVSMWIKLDTLITAQYNYYALCNIWTTQRGGCGLSYEWPDGSATPVLSAYTVYSEYAPVCWYAAKLTIGKWYHVALATSGSGGTLSLYFNGVKYKTVNCTGGANTYAAATATRISSGAFSPTNYFDGSIDEVIISSVRWTDAEMLSYYNNCTANIYHGMDF